MQTDGPLDYVLKRLHLEDVDRAMLKRRRGFSDRYIDSAGLRSAGPYVDHIVQQAVETFGDSACKAAGLVKIDEIGATVWWPYTKPGTVIIPYMENDRCVLLRPHKHQPPGVGLMPYFTRAVYDPERWTVLTEGEFKALAAEQYGFQAMAVPGISSFAGKHFDKLLTQLHLRRVGNLVVLYDNEDKARSGSPRYKSNRWRRYDTQLYAARMAMLLSDSRRPFSNRVGWIKDEHFDESGKADIDGLLASGVSVEGFEAIIRSAMAPSDFVASLPDEARELVSVRLQRWKRRCTTDESGGRNTFRESRVPRSQTNPYLRTAEGFVWMKRNQDGGTPVTISNFTAQIVKEVELDDGAEIIRSFEVEAKVADEKKVFRVAATQFPAVSQWVPEQIGARAVIYPGHGAEAHVRTAIQLHSGLVPRRKVFRCVGWREIDGRMTYVHAGGAIGHEGELSDVETDLHGKLAHFRLPEPPQGPALQEAVRASLQLRQVASDDLMLPLLAATFRAALGPCDVSPFLYGPTGCGKSELAALCQQHYGAEMHARQLPASWLDTPNALGELLFLGADAIVVVDDFIIKGDRRDIAALQRAAERVLRGQGNGAGRARCRPDGSIRPERRPRGTVLVTGEALPGGESLLARILGIRLWGSIKNRTSPVNIEQLAVAQAAAADGKLAASMAAFVQHLASGNRLQAARRRTDEARHRWRHAARWPHARIPDNLAQLEVGLQAFVEFAGSVGALDPTASVELLRACEIALKTLGMAQQDVLGDSDPLEQYFQTLCSGLEAGVCYIESREGGAPEPPLAWGWRKHPNSFREQWLPANGERVGWIEGNLVYLIPRASVRVVQQLAAREGSTFPSGTQDVARLLYERGLLAKRDKSRRDAKLRVTDNQQIRGWCVLKSHLSASGLAPLGLDAASAEGGAGCGGATELPATDQPIGCPIRAGEQPGDCKSNGSRVGPQGPTFDRDMRQRLGWNDFNISPGDVDK
jgi:hypothetical protein